MTPDPRTHDELSLDAQKVICERCGRVTFSTHPAPTCFYCRLPTRPDPPPEPKA